VTIKDTWVKLDSLRTTLLTRKRKCAELTIPAILPPEGSDENTVLPTPWQGLGARATNNLASKLLLTLLPPNTSSFRYDIPDSVVDELKSSMGDEGFKTKVQAKLSQIEQRITKFIESHHLRVSAFKALRALVCVGDSLLVIDDDGSSRTYRADSFVCRRSPMGDPIEVIIRERVFIEDVPEAIKQDVQRGLTESQRIELYTHSILQDNQWKVRQEINDIFVPGSDGTYPKDASPYIPLVWNLICEENYARSHVEEYIGDFVAYEGLSRALTEGSLAAARCLFLNDPNGTTKKKDLINARNLDIVDGRADDVTVLQLNKFADFKVAYEQAQDLKRRISDSFLLRESVSRDAERVTAEEIRYMAQDLEDSLGGIYSILSTSFLLRVIQRIIWVMKHKGEIPNLPDTIKPIITTGFEALGRGHDINKLNALFTNISQTFGPEALKERVDVGDAISRMCTAYGVDSDGLVFTDEQVKENQQTAMMSQMGQAAAPNLAKGLVDQAMQGQE
jgi:hypothetical protein